MNDEKNHVAGGQPEVLPARPLIAAEQRCQPGELNRLVNNDSGDQRSGAHQDHGCVGNLLRAVEFSRRGLDFAQMQIVKRDPDRFPE